MFIFENSLTENKLLLNNNTKLIGLTLLMFTGVFLSLFYGGSESIARNSETAGNFIFNEIRIPKTITSILAGITLSVSGLILQIIFRNPLAGPYVLGISSGASLMVAIGLLTGSGLNLSTGYFAGKSVIMLSAITGSTVITFLILAISKRVSNNIVLLLIGLMISQICGAIEVSLEYFSDPGSLKSFVIWGMGSLGTTTNTDLLVFAPVVLLFLALLFLFIKPLNAFLLGQNYALNSGINYNRNRFFLILISSALTGITTAFCGPIAFIGIAVPILSRVLFKTSKQQLHLIACMLIGSIIMLFSDALSHSLLDNVSLPINVITTFIGAPIVIWLMFKNKQW